MNNKIELKKEIVTTVKENEILMSFNNDSDAELYVQWWNDVGRELIEDYLFDKNF